RGAALPFAGFRRNGDDRRGRGVRGDHEVVRAGGPRHGCLGGRRANSEGTQQESKGQGRRGLHQATPRNGSTASDRKRAQRKETTIRMASDRSTVFSSRECRVNPSGAAPNASTVRDSRVPSNHGPG